MFSIFEISICPAHFYYSHIKISAMLNERTQDWLLFQLFDKIWLITVHTMKYFSAEGNALHLPFLHSRETYSRARARPNTT